MNDAKNRRLRDKSSGAATLINDGCKISGVITGSGDFLINGEVDGDCDISGTITLAHNGRWQGTIKADDIIIAGQVDGDIIAIGKVEITNSAKISGTVTAEAIAVAEGAIVEGVMKTTGNEELLNFTEKRNSEA